jgi:hypothetical protein
MSLSTFSLSEIPYEWGFRSFDLVRNTHGLLGIVLYRSGENDLVVALPNLTIASFHYQTLSREPSSENNSQTANFRSFHEWCSLTFKSISDDYIPPDLPLVFGSLVRTKGGQYGVVAAVEPCGRCQIVTPTEDSQSFLRLDFHPSDLTPLPYSFLSQKGANFNLFFEPRTNTKELFSLFLIRIVRSKLELQKTPRGRELKKSRTQQYLSDFCTIRMDLGLHAGHSTALNNLFRESILGHTVHFCEANQVSRYRFDDDTTLGILTFPHHAWNDSVYSHNYDAIVIDNYHRFNHIPEVNHLYQKLAPYVMEKPHFLLILLQ